MTNARTECHMSLLFTYNSVSKDGSTSSACNYRPSMLLRASEFSQVVYCSEQAAYLRCTIRMYLCECMF